MKTAVEMTGHGRRGKPNAGFPQRPPPLEIACAIPTFPPPRRSSGKWKTKNRFPTFHCLRFPFFDQIQKGGLAVELRSSSRLIVRLETAEIGTIGFRDGTPRLDFRHVATGRMW